MHGYPISFSIKPNDLGHQYVRPAKHPNTTPPIMTLWKCAIRNRLLCRTKFAPGTASRTPVIPPIEKVTMKPIVHSIAELI